MPAEVQYFADADDARNYLRELAVLWGTWVIGLVVLFVNNGWALAIGGIIVIVALFQVVKPLQARVNRLIPDNELSGEGNRLTGPITTRDRMLRKLAYGDEPIKAALELTDGSPAWLLGRYAILALTVGAFIAVIVTF